MTASVLLATLREPPRAGSLREMVLHLFLLEQEINRADELKLLVSAMVNKDNADAITKAWSRHIGHRFPWLKAHKKNEEIELKKVMDEQVAKGAFRITPVLPPSQQPRKLQPLPSTPRKIDSAVIRPLDSHLPFMRKPRGRNGR